MRRCVIYLVFVTNIGLGAQPDSANHQSMVLSGDDLMAAGITKLTDVFMLVTDWQQSTLDGHSWQLSPRGLSPFHNVRWSVYLDGHKMDVQWLDFNHLNMLPITVDMISRIEFFTLPTSIEGSSESHGALYITTTRPRKGFSAASRVLFGNESGDTGPYRFTKYVTTNVDRSASDASISVYWTGEKFHIRGGVIVQHSPSSDVALLSRYEAMVNDWPSLHRSIIPSAAIGYVGDRGEHELLVTAPTNWRYFYHSMPLAVERAVNSSLPQLSIRGKVPAANNRTIGYRANYSQFTMSPHPDAQIRDTDWVRQRLDGVATLYRPNTNGDSFISFSFITETSQIHDDSTRSNYGRYGINGSVPFYASDGIVLNLSGELATAREQLIGNLIANFQFLRNGSYPLIATIGIANMYSGGHSFGWYRPLANESTCMTDGKRLSFDLKWRMALTPRLLLDLSLYHRTHLSQDYIATRVALEPTNLTIVPTHTYERALDGTVVGGQIGIRYSASAQLVHKFDIAATKPNSDDDRYTSAAGLQQRINMNYQLTWKPQESFSVWGMLRYSSSTIWPQFSAIDGVVFETDYRGDQKYSSTLPSYVSFDIKARKLLAGGRLDANLILRNIFNDKIRYHPLGAAFDFTLIAELGLAL